MTVNLTNSDENTPLHVSAAWGNLEASKDFVESGALLKITNNYGHTALMPAPFHGKSVVVHQLREIDGNLNVGSETNTVVLLLAV
jgi:ankyrin repeat protein